MANDYSSLVLLKQSLKVVDVDRDDLLNAALTAASRGIDDICGRRFFLDASPSPRVLTPRGHVVCDDGGDRLLLADVGSADGLVVEIGRDPNWTDVTSQVELQPTDALAQGRPVTSLFHRGGRFTDRVRVTAQWGWPTVPDVVNQATLIQAGRLFKRKDSPEGVLGSAEWGTVRVARIDPDVSALISHLMMPGFG